MKKIVSVCVLLFLLLISYINKNIRAQDKILSPEAAAKLNSIIKIYKPSNTICLPPINRSVYNPKGGDEKLQLACLITGNRSVVLTEQKIAEQLFGSHMQAILAHKNIKTINFKHPNWIYNIVFYNQEGERSALLLLKSILMKKNKEDEINDYLWGTLLGYGQPNIELFYELDGFNTWLRDTGYEGDLLDRDEFTIWPQNMKNKFKTFERMWHSTDTYKKYKKDKVDAEQWIKSHATMAIDNLHQQINELLAR